VEEGGTDRHLSNMKSIHDSGRENQEYKVIKIKLKGEVFVLVFSLFCFNLTKS
jgi:hypothetical protein